MYCLAFDENEVLMRRDLPYKMGDFKAAKTWAAKSGKSILICCTSRMSDYGLHCLFHKQGRAWKKDSLFMRPGSIPSKYIYDEAGNLMSVTHILRELVKKARLC